MPCSTDVWLLLNVDFAMSFLRYESAGSVEVCVKGVGIKYLRVCLIVVVHVDTVKISFV